MFKSNIKIKDLAIYTKTKDKDCRFAFLQGSSIQTIRYGVNQCKLFSGLQISLTRECWGFCIYDSYCIIWLDNHTIL